MLGIIINSVRVGEGGLRLTVFTESGIQYLTARGVLKPRAKLAGSTALFTVAEFTTAKSAITGIDVLVSPFAISREINRYYVAAAVADSLQKMEFVENTPHALVLAITAITDLATTTRSCYPIFIEYFSALFELLGYTVPLNYDPTESLSLDKAKKLCTQICDAYLANMDYKISVLDGFI